ncbi:hypothetical protein AAON49_06935 [Pseudotenacibaculum sp. MALMAid0570]|uniref:hypothetical protein n=1 Tax=Pseudotenacibaculum sp. MALMAid0570 TaxID=3143938 RepID=UPI0032E0067E
MSKKKKVLLLIQSGYSARNFILSGFLNQPDLDFVFWSDQDYIEQYGIENQFVKLPKFEYNSKINFLLKVKNRAELFFNVKRTGNKNYLSYLVGIYKNQSLRSKLRNNLIKMIANFYANAKGIENLDKPLYKRIRKTSYYKNCKDQLIKENPSVVYCTHQRASNALAPMLAARDLGIKTICFIHSWDNIPKGVQLVKADKYFVWSSYMKDEMIEHYPFINENDIKVTGTPQFTYYFNDEYRLERSVFFNQFDLDTQKKYILFSGNDKTTSPNDPVYLSDLCKSIKELNKEEDIYRVLFRPNPIDRNEGFNTVLDEFSDVLTEIKPDWFGTDVFLWNKGGPSKKDVSLLINTIIHSDLIVNMGSTMALDAAILGKPSCYINYDVESTFDWSVNRTYKFIHFKMIKDIDPVFWINNREARLEVLKEALTNTEDKKEGREKWMARATQLPIEETINRMWKYLV